MLIYSILFFLLSNAVNLRRDKSILFSPTVVDIINFSFLAIVVLYIRYIDIDVDYGGHFSVNIRYVLLIIGCLLLKYNLFFFNTYIYKYPKLAVIVWIFLDLVILICLFNLIVNLLDYLSYILEMNPWNNGPFGRGNYGGGGNNGGGDPNRGPKRPWNPGGNWSSGGQRKRNRWQERTNQRPDILPREGDQNSRETFEDIARRREADNIRTQAVENNDMTYGIDRLRELEKSQDEFQPAKESTSDFTQHSAFESTSASSTFDYHERPIVNSTPTYTSNPTPTPSPAPTPAPAPAPATSPSDFSSSHTDPNPLDTKTSTPATKVITRSKTKTSIKDNILPINTTYKINNPRSEKDRKVIPKDFKKVMSIDNINN